MGCGGRGCVGGSEVGGGRRVGCGMCTVTSQYFGPFRCHPTRRHAFSPFFCVLVFCLYYAESVLPFDPMLLCWPIYFFGGSSAGAKPMVSHPGTIRVFLGGGFGGFSWARRTTKYHQNIVQNASLLFPQNKPNHLAGLPDGRFTACCIDVRGRG